MLITSFLSPVVPLISGRAPDAAFTGPQGLDGPDDLVETPLEVVVADDERWRDPERPRVGTVGEHSSAEHCFDDLSGGGHAVVEVEAGPEPASADCAYPASEEPAQPRVQV